MAVKSARLITLPNGIRERLWRRVKERCKSKHKLALKPSDTQWVQPSIVGRVRYLKGELPLRHASLKEWRDAEDTH